MKNQYINIASQQLWKEIDSFRDSQNKYPIEILHPHEKNFSKMIGSSDASSDCGMKHCNGQIEIADPEAARKWVAKLDEGDLKEALLDMLSLENRSVLRKSQALLDVLNSLDYLEDAKNLMTLFKTENEVEALRIDLEELSTDNLDVDFTDLTILTQ